MILRIFANFNNFEKPINNAVNLGLKNLANWLIVNKISLNVGKTELVLFTSPEKQLDSDLKIKTYKTDSVKHLGIQIDASLA